MTSPKFVLIGRRALQEKLDEVKLALAPIALEGAFVASPVDANEALKLTEAVAGLRGPFAIVADFAFSCAVIDDEGNVEQVPLRDEKPEEQPLVMLVEGVR